MSRRCFSESLRLVYERVHALASLTCALIRVGLDLGNSLDRREREGTRTLIHCTQVTELPKKKSDGS